MALSSDRDSTRLPPSPCAAAWGWARSSIAYAAALRGPSRRASLCAGISPKIGRICNFGLEDARRRSNVGGNFPEKVPPAAAGAAWHGGGDGKAASRPSSLAVRMLLLLCPRSRPCSAGRGGRRAGGGTTLLQPPRSAASAGRQLLLSAGERP